MGHDGTTSSRELNAAGREFFGPEWLGVFASDQIPPAPARGRSFALVNLDTSSGRGTHWTARYTENGTRMYYDSFARRVSQILPHVQGAVDTDTRASVLDQNRVGAGYQSCGQRSIAALLVARDTGTRGFMQM